MNDIDDYARRLLLSNTLREMAVRAAIRHLGLPSESRGLDVGCGIGLHAPLLAQAVGSYGHVVGVDLSPEFLMLAEDYAQKLDLSAQVTFQLGNMTCLLLDDNLFDWVWCADTLHPSMFDDPLQPVREMIRVVRPGGSIILAYWSAQKLLPGYPRLEARLDAAFADSVPYIKGVEPRWQFSRALGWLREAGLENLSARTFTADVCAPLNTAQREALALTFDMFWGGLCSALEPQDWAEFERLCRPESPDFMPDRDDYHAFLTYTLFQGVVNKSSQN